MNNQECVHFWDCKQYLYLVNNDLHCEDCKDYEECPFIDERLKDKKGSAKQ